MKMCEIAILSSPSHELSIIAVFNLNFNILAIMSNTITNMVLCLKCDIQIGHS